MKILVLNCGSSSIKYQLFEMPSQKVLAKGLVDKVGMEGAVVKFKNGDGEKISLEKDIPDHKVGIAIVLNLLTSDGYKCIDSLDEIQAVGHRIVHGGEKFSKSVLITNDVVEEIENCISLAPLHNPPNLKGIYAINDTLPNIPQVAVFDTAFHQTMPAYAYMYGVPYKIYKKHAIRRYGFHGTSHRYICQRACDILNVNIEDKKIITCHLGNGASLTAINKGKSADTSMGLTPVEGLIMGTRTGDIDAGAVLDIMDKEKLSPEEMNNLINKQSGIWGVTEISSDMRDIEIEAWENKNQRAQLALDMYHYRIRKYIGSFSASMGGVDILIFAGGVGENGAESREEICKNFEYLGLEFDKGKNENQRGEEVIISKEDSKVTAMVVPTNEELMIAVDTQKIIQNK